MSPEYALDGFFSVKSDVFSFGVVILEIISGKRNTGFYQLHHELSLLGYVSILNLFAQIYLFIYFSWNTAFSFSQSSILHNCLKLDLYMFITNNVYFI